MNKSDFDQFGPVWRAACEVYNVTPTDAALGLTFRVLEKYELHDIKVAIADYLATGHYPPKPADIVSRLNSVDGRLSADEAWSKAIIFFDSGRSVVMNDDIAQSVAEAEGIYLDGDKVGARMAFRAAYDRNVMESRKLGKPVTWWPSLNDQGDEPEKRAVLELGVVEGLLTAQSVAKLLPSPQLVEPSKLLAIAHQSNTMTEEEIQDNLKQLREWVMKFIAIGLIGFFILSYIVEPWVIGTMCRELIKC